MLIAAGISPGFLGIMLISLSRLSSSSPCGVCHVHALPAAEETKELAGNLLIAVADSEDMYNLIVCTLCSW